MEGYTVLEALVGMVLLIVGSVFLVCLVSLAVGMVRWAF